MKIDIKCYFCFEIFIIETDVFDGVINEIWDCEICCNPNKILYQFYDNSLIRLEVSNGND